MFLTPGELYQLTHYKHALRQKAALITMGVPYRVRPDGSLAVARAIFDKGTEYRATIRSEPQIRLERRARCSGT